MYRAALSLLVAELRSAFMRRMQGAVIAAVGAALLLYAGYFLLVSLRDFIGHYLQPDVANVVLGGGLLIAGGIVAGIGLARAKGAPKRTWPAAAPEVVLSQWKSVNPLWAVGAVMVMGLLAGRKIRKSF